MDLSVLFLVRCWRTASTPSGFRASVRRVGAEEAHAFTRAEDLVRHLDQQLPPAASPPAPTPTTRRPA